MFKIFRREGKGDGSLVQPGSAATGSVRPGFDTDWSATKSRQMGVSMNNKRTYLDTLNAGRQRRPGTSLEQITQSLQNLESKLDRSHDGPDEFSWNRSYADPQRDNDDRESPRADLGFGPRYAAPEREAAATPRAAA